MRTRSDLIDVEDRGLTPIGVVARIVDYLFGLLYALLALRLLLELVNARQDAGFFVLVRKITNPFYAPFDGLVPTATLFGVRIVWSLVVAILVYMVLHAAIRGLLRLVARA